MSSQARRSLRTTFLTPCPAMPQVGLALSILAFSWLGMAPSQDAAGQRPLSDACQSEAVTSNATSMQQR